MDTVHKRFGRLFWISWLWGGKQAAFQAATTPSPQQTPSQIHMNCHYTCTTSHHFLPLANLQEVWKSPNFGVLFWWYLPKNVSGEWEHVSCCCHNKILLTYKHFNRIQSPQHGKKVRASTQVHLLHLYTSIFRMYTDWSPSAFHIHIHPLENTITSLSDYYCLLTHQPVGHFSQWFPVSSAVIEPLARVTVI